MVEHELCAHGTVDFIMDRDGRTTLRHARVLAVVIASCSSAAVAADADVQRQLRQREQAQTELQLKMQQQAERAVQPPRQPEADSQRRMLERDQQQRLRESHERESRAEIPGTAGGEAAQRQLELERQRASQKGAGQLERFEAERRYEAERAQQ